MTLQIASSDSGYLIKNAIEGLSRIFKQGLKYKRVGVSLIGLFPDNCIQGNLFVESKPKNIHLQKTIDLLNLKYEQDTVRIASSGFNKQLWESKAKLRSPRYSTRLNEILNIGSDVLSF